MIHRIIALIIKELQEQFSTRRGVMVLIVPILMQTLLFPFVATQDVTHCEVVVLCDDTGASATELMQRFAGAPYITEVKRAYSVKEMTDALDSQQCMVGVHIPSDFSRCLARGESAPLQVVCDGLRSNSSQIAAGYITSIASGLAEQNGSRLGGPTLRHLYNPTLNYRWFILACLFGMLGMITSMNISCMALAREREAGTYEQLCVTPLGAAELLIGKTVPATLILLGQCFIILLVATCGFGLPLHGSVAALYIALAIYSLSLTGIGFAISAFCKTQQQAFVGMFCFALPAVLLSGFIAPADNMPELLQWVSRCDPLYYIFIVTRGVFMKGYTLSDIIPQLTAFACIAAITMSTAYIVLKIKKG